MSRAVLDTSVLFGWRSQHDVYHDDAQAIVDGVRDGTLPQGVVPSNLLQETLKHVQNHRNWMQGVRTLDTLSGVDTVLLTLPNELDQQRGRMLYRKHEGIEITSAVVVAYMRRERIELIYGFGENSDYDRFDDIIRLNAAENPY